MAVRTRILNALGIRDKVTETAAQAAGPSPIETRAMDVPEKVYVYKDGFAAVDYSAVEGRIADILNGAYADVNFIELFNCVPEIAAPVHEIATRVADANFKLMKTYGDKSQDTGNAQFNRLFSQPNPLQGFRDMIYQAVCYELLTGKQFFYVNAPGMLPVELATVSTWCNLPAHQTRIIKHRGISPYDITDISELIDHYEVPGQNGRMEVKTVDRVTPIVRMSLYKGNDITCASPQIRGAEKAIHNLLAVYEARGVIYLKRGHLGILVSAKSDQSGTVALTPGEKKELVQDLHDDYGLRRDKSIIAVTNQPLSFIQTSMSIADLQPFNETLQDAVSIYKVLGVPRHLVPSIDNSTFANADADMKEFYNSVIIPKACQYAAYFTELFRLNGMRRVILADFSHVLQIQENRLESARVDQMNGSIFSQAFFAGVCTLNDWIVSRKGERETNDLYNKKIYMMTPEELATIKTALNLKSNGATSQDPGATQTGAPVESQSLTN